MSETTATITTQRRPRQPDCRLTDQQLADLITRERPYKVFDGNSLFVLVTPSGQRSWRWRYYIRGREKVLLLGSYPEVSLQQARAARDQARDKVQAGIDPADEKREAKLALLIAQESSFEAVARAWHSRWSPGRHARYAEDVMSRLERNVFPVLGHKPMDQIEPKHVVAMMERVQGRGATDVARRVRNTCSQVLSDLKARGTLVCGTFSGAEPFAFQDPATRELKGYDVDVCKALAAQLGVKAETKIVSLEARIPELQQGRVDVLAAVLGYNPARAEQIAFSNTYFVSRQVLASKSGAFRSRNELNGKRISTVKGSSNIPPASEGAATGAAHRL